MKEVIYIEITKSFYKEGTYRVRIGDIRGSIESSNVSKEEVMSDISDAFNELDSPESPSVGENIKPTNGVVVRDNRIPTTVSNIETHQDSYSTKKGCGKRMDALGYIICGNFDDLKHGAKQWLCNECKKSTKNEQSPLSHHRATENERVVPSQDKIEDIHSQLKDEIQKGFVKGKLSEVGGKEVK